MREIAGDNRTLTSGGFAYRAGGQHVRWRLTRRSRLLVVDLYPRAAPE